jgi:hypothetical protein
MTYPIKQVRPGLYRGPRPALSDIPYIAALGIKYVLNLEALQPGEMEAFETHGVKLLSQPWSEILPPSIAQMKSAAVYAALLAKRGLGLLEHCTHGVDRTGVAVFADRIVNCGWTFDRAYQEMLDMGHNVFFYWWWRKRLNDFARKYDKGISTRTTGPHFVEGMGGK